MKHVIVKNIERADAAIIAKLGEQGASTVCEAQDRTGVLLPYMRPIYPTARVAGSAVTVLCHPGDNLMIHAAIEVCQPGDVMVVVTTSESTCALFGELLATSCRAHGVRGLIIEAGIRDVTDLTAMDFPVWAKAINPIGPLKAVAGSVNVEVVCAGVHIRPGDIIVGDVDGVVVVKREHAEAVAALGDTRVAKEQAKRIALKEGKLGIDLDNARPKLKELGVEYV
jgi:4-hydroxy-4-methyl-2-oxoglutarate aldolase